MLLFFAFFGDKFEIALFLFFYQISRLIVIFITFFFFFSSFNNFRAKFDCKNSKETKLQKLHSQLKGKMFNV